MRTETLVVGPLAVNCYLLDDGDGRVLVIDPGAEAQRIRRALGPRTVAGILLTHGHFDHIGAVDDLGPAPLMIHAADAAMLGDPLRNGSGLVPGLGAVKARPADRLLAGGEEIPFGNEVLTVVHLPGHTAGSAGFLLGERLFAGDTLFHRSIGRTDLPGGDGAAILDSIRGRLWPLADGVVVLPGHGPPTTIGEERRLNPFCAGA